MEMNSGFLTPVASNVNKTSFYEFLRMQNHNDTGIQIEKSIIQKAYSRRVHKL